MVTVVSKTVNPAQRIQSWWTQGDDENTMCSWIWDTIGYLEKNQHSRRERCIQNLRLYGNVDYMGIGPFSYFRTQTENLPENRVKINIIASMCDTVSAKISKMKPKVTFLTSGGDFEAQSKARKLQKFVIGLFYENDVYVKHRQMFKDSTILDIGALKHFVEGKKIKSERVLPWELFVDNADAMYGQPSHMYHVKTVMKEHLVNEYPEKSGAIMSSTSMLSPQTSRAHMSVDEEREFVAVVESWHLDTGNQDGWHVISTSNGILHKKRYKKDYFPFTFDRWTPAMVGFYGQSLAERLLGNQIEINKMLRIIQRSFHLGSAFKVFLEFGSKIAKEHINNDIGSLIYYSGQPPNFHTPQTVHPEYFHHLEWLIKNSYDEAGVSQMAASSKLPPGIDQGSGKAIREFNDLDTERFILQAQEYEETFLHTARIYVDLARDIGDYEVVAESKRFIETINWKDIDLENNEFVMQMFPTSSLPQTPYGKLAYVRELMQDGFVDQNFALSLLEFPDIEGFVALKTAPLDDIMRTLEQILYHGKFITPEPFQNLELGLSIFQNAYLRARSDNVPKDRLELLQRWITLAQAMKDQAQGPQQQQPFLPAGEQLRAKGQLPDPAAPISGGASNPLMPQTGAQPPGPPQAPSAPSPPMGPSPSGQ